MVLHGPKEISVFKYILMGLIPIMGLAQETEYTWTKQNTTLELTWLALNTADILQTLTFKHSCADGNCHWQPEHYKYHYEINPLLGKYPHKDKIIAAYFIGSGLHYAISRLLPQETRIPWQSVTIMLSADAVSHNYSMGFKIKLP